MTTSRDPDRLIRAFLLEGEVELHDQVYDAVRAEIEHKRQRVFIGPWRTPSMNKIVGIGLAAAAVIAALFIGSQFLAAPANVGGPGVEPTATPEASVAEPTDQASGEGPSSLLDSPDTGDLPPGRYYLEIDAYPGRIEFEVPEGWWYYWPEATREDSDVHAILVNSIETGAANGSAWGLAFAVIGEIRVDPCDAEAGTMDPSVAASAGSLAAAFSSWPDIPATSVDDVTIGGYAGKRVELSAESSTCLSTLFTTPAGYSFDIQRARADTPAPPEQFTFLDVEGSVLAIWTTDYPGTNYWEIDGGASYDPQAHADDQVELKAILDSIVIEP